MNIIKIKAPAKINIGLYVLSKRNDGYHNILTLFYPVENLFDEITIEKSGNFSFVCNCAELKDDKSNLVIRAKNLIEKYSGVSINVKIDLIKNIPIGAGLGGGSSDAAAVLKGLNYLFGLKIDLLTLKSLALELGSDVPFFINKNTAVGYSRGEDLQEINFKIRKPILIVNPGIHISTKEAFQNIKPQKKDFDYSKLLQDAEPNYKMMREALSNVFEEYVFGKYKEVSEIKEKMYSNGALFSLMSGSGSTVYGIFENFSEAEKTYKCFPENYFRFISNPDL